MRLMMEYLMRLTKGWTKESPSLVARPPAAMFIAEGRLSDVLASVISGANKN